MNKWTLGQAGKTKPIQSQNKPNSKPIQTQNKAKQSQFQGQKMPHMKINPRRNHLSYYTGKSYSMLGYLVEFSFRRPAYRAFIRRLAPDGIAAYLAHEYRRLRQVRTRFDRFKGLGVKAVMDFLYGQRVLKRIKSRLVALLFRLGNESRIHLFELMALPVNGRLQILIGALDAFHCPKMGMGMYGLGINTAVTKPALVRPALNVAVGNARTAGATIVNLIRLVGPKDAVGKCRITVPIVVHPAAVGDGRITAESTVGDRRAAVFAVENPAAVPGKGAAECAVGHHGAAVEVEHPPAAPVVGIGTVGVAAGDCKALEDGVWLLAAYALDDMIVPAAVDGGIIGSGCAVKPNRLTVEIDGLTVGPRRNLDFITIR